MTLQRAFFVVTAAALLTLAAACGGDGDDNGDTPPTSTPPAASPTNTPPPASPSPGAGETPGVGAPTGIDSVDAILEVVEGGGSLGALDDLVLFRQVACTTTTGQGPGGPPPCREGETEGMEVLVVFGASCEGYYAREDELPFQRVLLAEPPLYGVFRTGASRLTTVWPDAEYAVVLGRAGGGEVADLAFTLFADDEGIVGFSEGCGETPEQYAQAQGLTDAIVPPSE
jgi:hypothetical protein